MTEGITEERRAYCRLCKDSTEKMVSSACSKSKTAMYLSAGLLGVCFILSGIAWSAKSDVTNQKDTLSKISTRQENIATNIDKIAEFIDLLKKGNINLPKDNGNSGPSH